MRTLLATVALATLAGCTHTKLNQPQCLKCEPVEQMLEPIIVSGPFAVARSFDGEENGIPLTDIVDQSLRPGYRAYSMNMQPAVQQTSGAAESIPTVEVPAELKAAVRGWVRAIPADATDALGNVKLWLKNKLQVDSATADTKLAQLKTDFGSLPPNVPGTRIDEFWKAFKKEFNLREDGDPVPTATPAPVQTAVPNAAQTALSSARVVVNRTTGTRLIMPLQSVLYTSAGDVRVLPGESVEITRQNSLPPAAAQPLSNRNNSSSVLYADGNGRAQTLRLAGKAPRTLEEVFNQANSAGALVGPENSVRVSRLAADGVSETYILPMAKDLTGDSSLLQNFDVVDGDVIRFDMLDRAPDIRRARDLVGRVVQEEVENIHTIVEDRLSTATGGRTDAVVRAKRRIRGNVGRFGRRVQGLVPRL